EDIGGMNEQLMDGESVNRPIGKYELQIENKLRVKRLKRFEKKAKNKKVSGPDEIP
ncbi:hypothetical protein FHG87_018550, partial [Trinorchestia longiramus]